MDRRMMRYQAILPVQRLKTDNITIIGIGAVGRQLALQLAAMGIQNIELYDADKVEDVNLGPQAYMPIDIGSTKVGATGVLMQQFNPDISLTLHDAHFEQGSTNGEVVFCCVDSISTRKMIAEEVQGKCRLFVDGRMGAEVCRVLSATDTESFNKYHQTIFPESEAHPAPCTAKSTIYCATVLAGFMIGQYAKWLRDIPLNTDFMFNFIATELGEP